MRRPITFLLGLLITTLGPIISATAQSERSGEPMSLAITFNDGHHQSIQLDEVSRIEFKSGPLVIFKDGRQQEMKNVARIEFSSETKNLPFGRNSMFKKVAGKPLPDFAKEIDCTSFAQLFLKYNLSHPAVTAVIPGTDLPQYMLDNLNAGRGRMPDAAMRRRIEQWFDTI